MNGHLVRSGVALDPPPGHAAFASAQAGAADALRLISAVRAGGDYAKLVIAAIDKLTALRDSDRLASFHRTLVKARRG